jgi:hypothetical protein
MPVDNASFVRRSTDILTHAEFQIPNHEHHTGDQNNAQGDSTNGLARIRLPEGHRFDG